MKNLTSLLLACMFCFVGLSLTGCDGAQENTVVESPGETGDAALETQEDMDSYEAEMKKAMSQGQGN